MPQGFATTRQILQPRPDLYYTPTLGGNQTIANRKVVTVTTLTSDAIQTAVNSITDGGIVLLTPGTYTISSQVTIAASNVWLIGGFATARPPTVPSATSLPNVIFNFETDTPAATFNYLSASNVSGLMVYGIYFAGFQDPESTSNGNGMSLTAVRDYRIHHCYFDYMGESGVRHFTTSRGLVDHCGFYHNMKDMVTNLGYGVEVGGLNTLAGSGYDFGSEECCFIEDCVFDLCRHNVAANRAARYTARYNYSTRGVIAHPYDSHGIESGSTAGTEWADINNNVINQTEHGGDPYFDTNAVRIRGGRAIISNNTIQGYVNGVDLTQDTDQVTGPAYIYGNSFDGGTGGGSLVTTTDTGVAMQWEARAPAGYTSYPYPHPLQQLMRFP